jgi:hypothetical protein
LTKEQNKNNTENSGPSRFPVSVDSKDLAGTPMGRYDITLRHLARIGCRSFLRSIGGEGQLTLLQTEFPSTKERRIDYLAVLDSPQRSRKILHIEIQADSDARMQARMLGYYSDILDWIIARPDDLIGSLPRRIVQKVVYVGAASWDPEPKICDDNLDFRFEFIDARELDARPLLETGDLGDAVIAVLCGDGTNPDVIKAVLNKIAQAPPGERADALAAQLIVLSELRSIRPLIEQEYDTMSIVVSIEDSTILRPPIDRAYAAGEAKGKAEGKAEGEAKGKTEGKAEGKAEGHAMGLAKAIVAILGQRFPGQVPAGLANRLSLVTAETLDDILRKSLTATSAADALGSMMPTNTTRPKA